MLSLTTFSPQITPFQQSPKLRRDSKRKGIKQNHEKPIKVSCFSCKISNLETKSDASIDLCIPPENPDYGFQGLRRRNGNADPIVLASWLQSSYRLKDVRRMHAVALKLIRKHVTYVNNNLVCSYLRLGKLIDARKVFDEMWKRNVVSWTAVINGYLGFGFEDEALRLFGEFLKEEIRPNQKMFVCVLNLCSKRLDFELGRQIHAHILKRDLRNVIVDSSIVYFYAQCGELASAYYAFDYMVEKDVVSWTTILSAFSQQGCGEKVFWMFLQMISDGFSPNEFTACSVLKACGDEKALKFGRQMHGAIVKKVFKNDVFIGSSLVDMYSKCGEILDSRKIFDTMRNRNTVTWTSMIAGYAREELGEEAISLFRVMQRRNIIANDLTIVSILRACGSMRDLSMGKEVHAQILKNRTETSVYIGSSLVWLYCKCGDYHTAFNVLQEMPLRDVVSWTAIISGCASLGHEMEALEFLHQMMIEGVEPNNFTYSSALKACANSESLLLGKSIHSVSNKNPGIMSNVFVGSALIHMYAKCGLVSEAFKVFDSMPERNSVSWKTMITLYARTGMSQEALKLMYSMQAEGFVVDDYLLTTILSACGGVEWDVKELSKYYLNPS